MERMIAWKMRLILAICACLAFATPIYACGQSDDCGNEKKAVAVSKAGGVRPATAIMHTSKMPKKPAVRIAGIDIKTLEKRLKNTDAIGFFTKLAIRNDIVDLMDKIKQYRKKAMLKMKMKEIRSSFDGLLLKIIALLEEDPNLSRDLYVGRESIWESLLEVKA